MLPLAFVSRAGEAVEQDSGVCGNAPPVSGPTVELEVASGVSACKTGPDAVDIDVQDVASRPAP